MFSYKMCVFHGLVFQASQRVQKHQRASPNLPLKRLRNEQETSEKYNSNINNHYFELILNHIRLFHPSGDTYKGKRLHVTLHHASRPLLRK